MQVFHYVADQLKEVELFEATSATTASEGTGAIFNDFDNPSPFDDSFASNLSFGSQTTQLSSTFGTVDEGVSVPEVDHAILESDRVEGLWNQHLVFDTDLFDYGEGAPDDNYYRKVHLLLTKNKDVVENISEMAERIFLIRHRNNWRLKDSVYDAWLIKNGRERAEFSRTHLAKQFPDLEKSQKKRRMSCSPHSCGEDLVENPVGRKKSRPSMLFQSSSEDDGDESPSMLSQSRIINTVPKVKDVGDIPESKPRTLLLSRFKSTLVDSSKISLISDDDTQTEEDEDNKDDILFSVMKFKAKVSSKEAIVLFSDEE